jgi:hypothetical protein
MGIRWVRTARIGKGRVMEAISWAKEVSAYAEKKFNTGKISVFMDAFGEVGTLRWMMDANDLAALEKIQMNMMADADYWKMIDRAMKAELFLEGYTRDEVMRSL